MVWGIKDEYFEKVYPTQKGGDKNMATRPVPQHRPPPKPQPRPQKPGGNPEKIAQLKALYPNDAQWQTFIDVIAPLIQ